jgi:hypothetical protein
VEGREKKKRERKYKKGNMGPKGSENGSESIGIRIPALKPMLIAGGRCVLRQELWMG